MISKCNHCITITFIDGVSKMKPCYENELDIVDDAIPQLRAIAHLFDCMFVYADTVGTNTQSDLETGDFLSSLLRDITGGIEKCLNNAIEAKGNHKGERDG
jgi:hypothetical protein